MSAEAILHDDGLVFCSECNAELECDHETGDMPDICPGCGALLDWSDFFPGGRFAQ